MMSYKEANDVLNYWFGGGDRSKRPRWFGGGEEAAQEIRDKFETLVSEHFGPLFVMQRYGRCHAMSSNSKRATKVFIFICQFIFLYIVSAPCSVCLLAFLIGSLSLLYFKYVYNTRNLEIKESGAVEYHLSFPQVARKLFGNFWYFELLFSFRATA